MLVCEVWCVHCTNCTYEWMNVCCCCSLALVISLSSVSNMVLFNMRWHIRHTFNLNMNFLLFFSFIQKLRRLHFSFPHYASFFVLPIYLHRNLVAFVYKRPTIQRVVAKTATQIYLRCMRLEFQQQFNWTHLILREAENIADYRIDRYQYQK